MAKLTQTQINLLNILKGVTDRAFARHVSRMRRKAIDWAKELFPGPDDKPEFDNALAAIASADKRAKQFDLLPWDATSVLTDVMSVCYRQGTVRRQIEAEIIADIRERAAEYELMAQMPPVRKERKKREPKTLVGRRADAVDEKVREWERKLKLAKTKLSAYRKKQKYYAKKGAVV